MMSGKVRVLIVDDSALVRQLLSQGLGSDPGIEVVATAGDPYGARDHIARLRPDVMTLDVEMPRMDGVEFLRRLMPQYPIPVVMVSSLTQRGKQITIDALNAGAVDFVAKPTTDVARGLKAMILELCAKVKLASTVDVSHWKNRRKELPKLLKASGGALAESTDKVIVIGASTGGTEATRRIITRLPAGFPGIVITQHMPPGFTQMYAESLNRESAMQVREAKTGDRVAPGLVLLAPGGKQMRVIRSGGRYEVICEAGPKVSGHCPSVDVLMESAARSVGGNAIGVMLTGMGSDGARGMLAMARAGARNIAQDEASCVVFGMPKVAFEMGGAKRLVPLDDIPPLLVGMLTERAA
ncbi:chemotaxis response regulator protein-glutamate methylesterase [Geothermobacter hydrogeniphilus]|uniref:Protein-glutamate methylesterase/protein-glutamine glutaminase n=2 Tax=Geothermobacter hydrogeniphilus TaxID=1969733 RepID=A0A2K2HCS9_9BACT|nr:chemotaxis response regulator protein-glutamate methylesterase [Geothermobacter hydrogeniphilus]